METTDTMALDRSVEIDLCSECRDKVNVLIEKPGAWNPDKWDKHKNEGKYYWRNGLYNEETGRVTKQGTQSPKVATKKAEKKGPPSIADLLNMVEVENKNNEEIQREVIAIRRQLSTTRGTVP